MKITKRQLRKIIREEKQRVQEQGDPNYPSEPWDSPIGDSIRRAVVKLLDADREEIFPKGDLDMAAFLMRLADDLKAGTV
jgi:hypothetical protein